MARVRWNFHIGPLQFTAPVGAASVAALLLCCCGSSIFGAFHDTPETAPPAAPVVETSAAPTDAIESAEPTQPAATKRPARIVHAGAYCDHAGAVGVTKAGAAMVCRGPDDLRWRRP